MSKERIYTAIVSWASSLVVAVPMLNLSEDGSYIATLILFTIASVFTQKKNRISVEINRVAVRVTNFIIAVIIVGAAGDFVTSNHFINIFNGISEHTIQVVRTVMALLILGMNNLSKTLFPSEEGQAIEDVKKQLENTQKFKQ